jgi:hypothetical protein
MLRRLFASTLVLGSAVVLFAPYAKAQSVDLTFSGSVNTSCTFGAPVPGTLIYDAVTPALLTFGRGGSRSSVTLDCATASNLSAGSLTQTGGPSLNLANCLISIGSSKLAADISVTNCSGSGTALYSSGAGTIFADLRVGSNTSFQPGTYSFKITLTATSN